MAFLDEDFEVGEQMQIVAHTAAVSAGALAPAVASEPACGIKGISQMLADPGVPITNIGRAIALEIAGVIGKMAEDRSLRHRRPRHELNDEIKAYRELQRSLIEGEALSTKDILNLDGPKFKFVFGEMIGFFQQALKGAGVDDQLAHNVVLQFGDLVKMNEENLRRELSGNSIG